MGKTRLKYTFIYSLLIGTIFFSSNIYAQQTDCFSILITGNTNDELNNSSLRAEWQKQLNESNNIACLFTGNTINSKGNPQLPFDGTDSEIPILIAPGKAEWLNGTGNGKEFLIQLETELPEKFEMPVYLPEAACPGPKEIILGEHVVVILLDTYWWVHKFDRRFNKCGIESQSDVLLQIEDAIRRNYSSKHVVLAGSHSLKSFGNTSGYFSLKQWLLETPKTFFRKLPGTSIDNQHPDFRGFRNGVLSILEKYPDVLYVSGGEANLQYFQYKKSHFVISGAWGKPEYVRKNLAEFGASQTGFARLDFNANGECSLTFSSGTEVLFNKIIYNKTLSAEKQSTAENLLLPDSVSKIASVRYKISQSKYKWLGENYRDVWETPVKFPVFDIGSKNGGLRIIKRGGGQQTYSLRLEDASGAQYVLRSVDKNVDEALPKELRNTFAVDIVQDQISASNPYAAPVVARLANQARVLHTNPEIFYVPDDPRFGIYRTDVANQLFLFEERPDNDYRMDESAGISAKVISTEDLVEKITKNHNCTFDKNVVVRARLFDVLINDWDRHDDQWRWAGIEQNDKTIYKPIPRDRDQAFFLNEGILPWITARKWLLPKIQGFDEMTENMDGQSFNARYFDRTFLTNCSWSDWLSQIDTLKILLDNGNIDSAMLAFPPEVYSICGQETGQILKSRLDNLETMASKLYLSLAKEVNIFGTNKNDFFEIIYGNENLRIRGYKLLNDKEKGDCFFDRKFINDETKIINLYGLQGNDRFEKHGFSSGNIKLKIIGGEDNDEVVGFNLRVQEGVSLYDKKSTKVSKGTQGRIKNKFDKELLEYDRENFEYDIVYPGIYSGFNPDDGMYIGGGPIFTKYSRYQKRRYEILGNYALATHSYNLRFNARNSYVLRHFDINFNAGYNSGAYAGNYFGMGNETSWNSDANNIDFYRLRMRRSFAQLDFLKWIDNNEVHKAGPGIRYLFADAEETPDRFISLPSNNLSDNDLLAHSYASIYFKYTLNTGVGQKEKAETEFAGSTAFPTRGTQIKTQAGYFIGINQQTDDFFKLSGDWITYLSFSQRPRVVYALRAGGEKLFGNYAFHQAAKLGNKENLRAYRETRFYGDASLYLNAEIRVRMKQFQTYLMNGTIGVLFFNDTGRVWLEGENSKRWHNGTGIGFWFAPFDMATLNVSYAISSEDQLVNFSVNYQF
jgi:hypothetical protein